MIKFTIIKIIIKKVKYTEFKKGGFTLHKIKRQFIQFTACYVLNWNCWEINLDHTANLFSIWLKYSSKTQSGAKGRRYHVRRHKVLQADLIAEMIPTYTSTETRSDCSPCTDNINHPVVDSPCPFFPPVNSGNLLTCIRWYDDVWCYRTFLFLIIIVWPPSIFLC